MYNPVQALYIYFSNSANTFRMQSIYNEQTSIAITFRVKEGGILLHLQFSTSVHTTEGIPAHTTGTAECPISVVLSEKVINDAYSWFSKLLLL